MIVTGTRRQQGGFTMLVVMLMMLMAALLVLTGAARGVLQERQTFVMRDINLAFQAADSAIHDGELTAYFTPDSTVWPNTGCSAGLCAPDTSGLAPVWLTSGLWGSSASAGMITQGTFSLVSQQPRFIVEQLPKATPDQYSSLVIGVTPEKGRVPYRITAYATGASPSTVVELQSVYLK